MSSFDLDLSELTALGDDLRASAEQLMGKVRPVVAKGALNVKESMAADMGASAHFGQAAGSISYSLKGNPSYAEAEVGPAKGGAGSLANIAYFGGAHGGGGTVRDPQGNLDDEAPDFEQALTAVIGDLL